MTIRYRIADRSLSTEGFVELEEWEFRSIVEAKKRLVIVVGIEEKFDLVLANYADYERQLLDLTLRWMTYRDLDWPGFRGDTLEVTRRLANLLSASRLYLDQLRHDIRRLYGRSSEQDEAVGSAVSAEYDGRLGYRVMEAMRNVMQHQTLPVHQLSYPSEWEGSEPGGALRFSIRPSINVDRLRDESEFKASVLAELEKVGPLVPLTPLVRDYVEGLAVVQESVREVVSEDVADAEATLKGVQARGTTPSDRKGRLVTVVALSESGEQVEVHQVFPELIEYRRRLQRRNSALENLSKRYVSGAC